MSTRVAVNGFGRIGRAVLRSAIEREADLERVAVNDVVDADALGHLLAFDSVYGRFAHPVRTENGALVVAGRRIEVLAEHDPRALLPWAELGADVVIEATGRFRTRLDAAMHIEAGARKVILSAPAKGPEPADAQVKVVACSEQASACARAFQSRTSSRSERSTPHSSTSRSTHLSMRSLPSSPFLTFGSGTGLRARPIAASAEATSATNSNIENS